MRNRFKSVAISYLQTAVSILVNLIYAPLLLKFVGQGEYGLYQLVASFFGYVTLLETSISTGVLKFYCASKAHDKKGMENVLAISRKIYRVFSILLVIVGTFLITLFCKFYQSSLSEHEVRESAMMFMALIFNLLITMNNAVYLAAIHANERFVFSKSLSIISQIAQPGVCVLVLIRYPYALTIVMVQLFVNLIVAFVRYFYAKNKLDIVVKMHKKDKYMSKNILMFSGQIMMASIADQIFWKTDQLILGKMYSTVIVAIYAIGAQLYSAYMGVGISISSVFFPKISMLYEKERDSRALSDLFIKVGQISFCVLFLIFSGFVIFGKEFVHYWVGDEYIKAYYVAVIVMFPFTIDLIQNMGLSILQVMNKYSFRAKMYFVSALLNIVSTCILAKYFDIVGAALSTGITLTLTSGVILNIYYIKVGLDISTFWKRILTILVKLLPLTFCSYCINKQFFLNCGLFGLCVKIAIYSISYLVCIYYLVLSKNEREGVLKSLHGKLTK